MGMLEYSVIIPSVACRRGSDTMIEMDLYIAFPSSKYVVILEAFFYNFSVLLY